MRFLLFMSISIASLLLIACEEKNTTHNITKDGVAIYGYDVVAYLDQQKPAKGEQKWAAKHKGITYWFSTAANQKNFKANPDKYLPQYGGWCAYAIGKTSQKVDINPETFKIKDGKTYLFYNKSGTNTLDLWNEDEANLFEKAEATWKEWMNKK